MFTIVLVLAANNPAKPLQAVLLGTVTVEYKSMDANVHLERLWKAWIMCVARVAGAITMPNSAVANIWYPCSPPAQPSTAMGCLIG